MEFASRLLIPLLHSLGWMLARCPAPLGRALAVCLGDALYFAPTSRRRTLRSNLHHAFPERSRAWRRRVGRESCRRLIETALFSLAIPSLSRARLRRALSLSPEVAELLLRHRKEKRAMIWACPHLAYWEMQTAYPAALEGEPQEMGILYRPLNHPGLDAWVKRTRERFGLKLLSRKEGFGEALKYLRRGGAVGVLFDQNAGLQGALSLFLDRVASTTELPGLLAEKFGAEVYLFFPHRLGYWRVELRAERILAPGATSAEILIGLNRALERALRSDDELCASWLWLHTRWRTQDVPERRLRLEQKRDLLAEELRLRGLAELPRRTRLWVRLPNWLGDVVMAAPLLRALRAARPDAEITLVTKAAFAALLERLRLADRVRVLAPKGHRRFTDFWRAREEFPDVYLLFTNSLRGDLEAWLTGCRQRFGLVRPGKRRPLLTHGYDVPAEFDERRRHQLELWKAFLQRFGLGAELDLRPFATPGPAAPEAPVGLICGSENTPAKRWPVAYWRQLIERMPERRFVLFGTAGDRPLTEAVAAGFSDRVENLAGRTDLAAFMDRLAACPLIVSNDTGGLHLANLLGVPTLALFGPTNPLRTGPVFSAPFQVLQPPGCAPEGGGSLADLAPETAVAAARRFLSEGKPGL